MIAQRAHVRILLLSACNMQELAIGGMEHGDAKGEVNAHDPKLRYTRSHGQKDIADDAQNTVHVQRDYADEKDVQSSDPEAWEFSVDVKKEYTTGQSNGPGDCKPNIRPAKPIDACLCHRGGYSREDVDEIGLAEAYVSNTKEATSSSPSRGAAPLIFAQSTWQWRSL